MTTVTLQLDEELLRTAREMAKERRATVSEVIVGMVQDAATQRRLSNQGEASASDRMVRWDTMLIRLGTFHTGGPHTRDEMNER